MKKLLVLILSFLIALSLYINPASAVDTDRGGKLFETHCAGCHPGGGNIIRRGKNLKIKALHKNKMDSLEAVITITTNGKNNMSAFGERLTPEEIKDISAYVLQRAADNWRG